MSEWFILIIPNILIIHVQLNHSKIILFIRIISIFAIIFIIHLRSSALTGSSQDSCVDKICWCWKINTHTYTYDFRPSLTLQNRFSIQTMSPCAGSSKAQASHTQAPAKHKLLSKAHALLQSTSVMIVRLHTMIIMSIFKSITLLEPQGCSENCYCTECSKEISYLACACKFLRSLGTHISNKKNSPSVIHFPFTKGAFSPDPLFFSPRDRDISKFRVCHETRRCV